MATHVVPRGTFNRAVPMPVEWHLSRPLGHGRKTKSAPPVRRIRSAAERVAVAGGTFKRDGKLGARELYDNRNQKVVEGRATDKGRGNVASRGVRFVPPGKRPFYVPPSM